MKKLLTISILLISGMILAQTKAAAPVNPVALNYTSLDLGLLGPVKTAGDLEFDSKQRLLVDKGYEPKKFTYSKNMITVEKYGSVYKYQLNDDNKIISYTIVGKDDAGVYKYDVNRNLIEEIIDVHNRITYTYDDQNRLIKKTKWYKDLPYPTTYEYYGTPESLEITITIDDDPTARATQVYKNGVFVNQIFHGSSDWENVQLDKYGNWTSYENVAYGTKEKREITYYE